jgi:DNA-binding PadR family transcriptional regulator
MCRQAHAFAFAAGPAGVRHGCGRGYAMTGRRHGHGPWGGAAGWAAWGGRRRMRRGDVRAAMLVLLDEGPQNGYGLMQEIERRSGGVWRPSPGSVYPALQQLEDEGLVRVEETDGRRLFHLTEDGRAHVAEHRDKLGEPWAAVTEDVGEVRLELRGLVDQLRLAVIQVAAAGDDAQVARAKELLAEARRALYRLLAEDERAEDEDEEA